MTQPSGGKPITAWRVTAQNEGMGKLPTGAFTQGVNVTFTTGDGITGTVFVPNSEYTPERVRQYIHDRVAILHSVAGLSGQVS